MENDWKPSMSIWDRGIEAVETAWNKFTTAMSFNTKGQAKEDMYVIGETPLQAGLHGSRTQDIIGFDGNDYRKGFSTKWPGGQVEDYWDKTKFESESAVLSAITAESTKQTVSDRAKDGAVSSDVRQDIGEKKVRSIDSSSNRQQISQADRDAARAAASTKTNAESQDHDAQRRAEVRSDSLEV